MFAKHFSQGDAFGSIVGLGPCPMGRHIIDVSWRKGCLRQGPVHGLDRTSSIRTGGGDVVGIHTQTIA